MSDEEGRRYLAHYMIDAWRRRGGDSFLPATIQRESFSESPVITFHLGGKDFAFGFGHTPFNAPEAERMISDKWWMFQALRDDLPLPYTETVAKNDPRSSAEIAEFIVAYTLDKWHPFSFPVVVKPREGSLSRNVFIVNDSEGLVEALDSNRADSSYGDGILIQQYLGDAQGPYQEMRAVCVDGRTYAAFDRQTVAGRPAGVLAHPLTEIDDPAVIAQIDAIAEPLHEHYGLSYVAFDMKRDRAGKLWIMEGNVAPMGLDVMESSLKNGRTLVPGLAEKMLDKVMAASPALTFGQGHQISGLEPEFS